MGINSTEAGIEALFLDLERVGTTLVPETGSADYAGSYLGQFWGLRGPGDVQSVGFNTVTGDVTFTADFSDTSTISGVITGRSSEGSDFADLDLELATITGGGFSGIASGGELAGETTSSGTYSGLLTGADGTEVIGGLSIDHSNVPGSGEFEVGVFIAEEP